ncbi:MAG: FadR family transcriptional regulator [Proteobacteria bacterium]|nr:FadR family transcriptional regulator [Pseudomonadota bacterium]
MVDAFEGFSVQSKNFSEQIRNVFRKAILEGRLKPGEKLPPEDKMALQFKVSKTAIREALGQLVAEGMIEKRRGAMGRSFVANGNSARILKVVVECYQLGGLTMSEVVDFRALMEPAVAEQACDQRTEQDLKAMRKNLKECRKALSAGKPDREKQVCFHRLLAAACHNRLISSSLDAVVRISRDFTSVYPATNQEIEVDLEYNKKIFECLKSRDKKQAREVLIEHFKLTREKVKAVEEMLREDEIDEPRLEKSSIDSIPPS